MLSSECWVGIKIKKGSNLFIDMIPLDIDPKTELKLVFNDQLLLKPSTFFKAREYTGKWFNRKRVSMNSISLPLKSLAFSMMGYEL